MRCDFCGKEVRKYKEGWPWRHDGCMVPYRNRTSMGIRKLRSDPERIIQEIGAKELSKTSEGRAVLQRARERYKAELVQPGDPEFKKLYGKMHKEQAEMKRENEKKAEEMWKERGIDRSKVIMRKE